LGESIAIRDSSDSDDQINELNVNDYRVQQFDK